MKLTHRAITSAVFELTGTYEIDIKLDNKSNEDSFSLRIELFRSLADKKNFRYKIWRDELFRIQSTFPLDNKGKHMHKPSDELILVGLALPHFGASGKINAESHKKALSKIIKGFGRSLEYITSEKLMIRKAK